jgi:DNA polymerase III epsilon subunit-like protein
MYLFFDTETNGKAKNFKAPVTDLDNWPRITQLGWQMYDEDGTLVEEKSILIKPEGWTIPVEKFFIDNNMSTERCEEFGIPLEDALKQLIASLEKSQYLIAHNMEFDINVLGAEFLRKGMKSENKVNKFCTMKESTSICKLPGARGYKWPTLTELHTFLFNEGFAGAHDALDDVKACAKSFFELKKRGLILKS